MGLLRLFLALVVAMAHLQVTDIQAVGLRFWDGYYLGFNAGYAVMAFYMISGFLISMVLASKYKNSPMDFYVKRGTRIFALYLPIAAVAFLLVNGTVQVFELATPLQKVLNFSLVGTDWYLVWNGPLNENSWLALPLPLRQAWTLSAELTFYLTAPWLLRSNIASALALIASAVIRFAIIYKFGWDARWLYFFLPSTFLFFLMGHWALVLSQHLALLRNAIVAIGLLGTCFAILIFAASAGVWDTKEFWIAMTCFALSLPGLFLLTKNNAALNWIGALSYPLYLVHNMTRTIAIETWHLERYVPHIPYMSLATAMMLPYLFCAVGAAVGAHYLLEIPCSRLVTWVVGLKNRTRGHIALVSRS